MKKFTKIILLLCTAVCVALGVLFFTGCDLSKKEHWRNDLEYFGYEQVDGAIWLHGLVEYEIEEIYIPKGTTKISEGVFKGHPYLKKVHIPDGLNITSSMFENCTALEEVCFHGAPTLIGENAFAGCTSLKSIEIPEGCETIGANSFNGCTSLSKIEVAQSIKNCQSGMFYGTAWWQEQPDGIVYCDTVVCGYKGEVIDTETFTVKEGTTILPLGCIPYVDGGFNEINLPSSLKYVCYENNMEHFYAARVNVTSLEAWLQVEFTGDGVYLPQYLFDGTGAIYVNGEKLVDLKIPEGIITISSCAFASYRGLESVAFSSTVEQVGRGAFANCKNIKKVYAPTLKDWLEIDFDYIYANPNQYAKNLIIDGAPLEGEVVVPSGIKSINETAFLGQKNINKITMTAEVESVGAYAFMCCEGLQEIILPNTDCLDGFMGTKYAGAEGICIYNDTENKSFYYPAGLKKITILGGALKEGDFKDFNFLETLVLPENIESHSWLAFENCKLQKLEVPNLKSWVETLPLGYITKAKWFSTYHPLAQGAKLYHNGQELSGEVIIPEGTTKIGAAGFHGCNKITSIYVPESVLWMDAGCFGYMNGLKELNIPFTGNRVGANPDTGADETTALSVLFAWEEYSGCYNVGTRYVPTSLTKITLRGGELEGYAFKNFISLKEISIAEGVTGGGYRAFIGCTNLTTVSIPSTVDILRISAFSGCNNLTNVTFASHNWKYDRDYDGTFDEDVDLSDPSYAAEFLKNNAENYSFGYLKKV